MKEGRGDCTAITLFMRIFAVLWVLNLLIFEAHSQEIESLSTAMGGHMSRKEVFTFARVDKLSGR